MAAYQSWGRYPPAVHRRIVPIHWRTDPLPRDEGPLLAYGLGRSYGDACLNDGAVLLPTRRLDRFIRLDREEGTLSCEAGVSLGEILSVVVPHGFFLPVVPGTKHVTVGGAIANDVHGKNHHGAGTFGAHVLEIELLRSDRGRVVCSPSRERALFAATVGGLGLTGIILSATVRLRRIGLGVRSVASETVPLASLDDFFARAAESDASHEFTVAWIDCLATGARLGRGLLYRGRWAEAPDARPPRAVRSRLSVPVELPWCPLNRYTVSAFNALYHAKNRRAGTRAVGYEPYFFPLDGVERWNRIYGRAGLLQFQCALPNAAAPEGMRALLGKISSSGEGSFLAVLKTFGPLPSPGLLSFPRQGATLALDFANRGERSSRLFGELHAIVAAHGGRIYPAKDAHMSPAQFETQHRDVLARFRAERDPAFSSSLWRRVTEGG